jgi:redox-sensitive bicupin YhaK (pirin superfamily)
VGFARHRHAGLVIVSWVLAGSLRHEAADGVVTVVQPGSVQVFSTGAGSEHGEFAQESAPTRFVQMAVLAGPDEPVGYRCEQTGDGPHAVAASVQTTAGSATLSVLRPAGASVALPAQPRRFLQVTRGVLSVATHDGSVDLRAGDSVRTTAAGPLELSGPAEALVWDLPA